MRVLVTGSSGHLGEALTGALGSEGAEVVGLDIVESATTSIVGSIADRALVRRSLEGINVVVHTATLHKPHVGTHNRRNFVDTNVSGTLNLLEVAADAGVGSFVFTSTTHLRPCPEPTTGRARNVDHRGRRPRPQERVRGGAPYYVEELPSTSAEGVGNLLKGRVADIRGLSDAIERVGGRRLDPEVVGTSSATQRQVAASSSA